jgi:hypothetical protein
MLAKSERLYNELMEKQFYLERSASDYMNRDSGGMFEDIQTELSQEQSNVIQFLENLQR